MSTTFADPADEERPQETHRRRRWARFNEGYQLPESQTPRGYEDTSDFVDEDGFMRD